ncbi:hypothetical protein Clacol_003680 [Clathrus columnatus]|uniref:Uncharacterized protein n=1 Tax=Clathrus columnatus TaxID=1419009 RepID=A0AAV5A719_9AGAM|nr:hypothetical protein Clacol_003680 [Clathrus columnatus]
MANSSSSYSTQKSYHVPIDSSTRHVQLSTSAWHVLEQPPPPTLREILNAYKSKGDGDREMLLAMLNAKSSEDQRIAAIATLHHKLLEHPTSQETHQVSSPSYTSNRDGSPYYQPSQQTTSQSYHHSSSLPRTSPSASPQTVTLPPIHVVGQQNSHKRSRSSQSPHSSSSYKRRHSNRDFDHSMAPNSSSNEQLPPSPPSSSPGRSTACSELAAHSQSRGDAMAIGSLLSSEQERDSEWPSRTSAERDRDREPATYHANKQSKVFG